MGGVSIRGWIDKLSPAGLYGWAQDPDRPGERMSLLVTADGELIGRTVADRHRPDVERAGIGDGRYGFSVVFDDPLQLNRTSIIRVFREADGQDIPKSPLKVTPPLVFDGDARRSLSAALAQFSRDDDIVEEIDFLVEETAKLMWRLADRDGDRERRRRDAEYLSRWRWRSPSQDADSGVVQPSARVRRALVVDCVTPKLNHDAGANAIIGHILSLRRLGFDVAFAAADELKGASRADASALESFGVKCFKAPYYGSVEDVMARQAGAFDLVYLHRMSNGYRYGALARDYFPRARLIYSVADLHHLRLARQAAIEENPQLVEASRAARAREWLAAVTADAVLTHSNVEASWLARAVPADRVHVASWPITLAPVAEPFVERSGVAFIGCYGHTPNIDAALWLISEIMPAVHCLDPSLPCWIVGPDLPKGIAKLCRDNVFALGHVEDLAEVFKRVRVTVAPLTYGAGVKGKVADSLAAGVPCVCTPVAAEGMGLPEPLLAHVSDNVEGIARAIVRLHSDSGEAERCARAGLDYIAERFSEAAVDAALRKAIGPAAMRPAAPAIAQRGSDMRLSA
jgi:glycosyltransferase involved in cell wall biosynthesis